MTPEEAGASLRDDPTFALMTREEQEEEAGLLLGTDDPLEIALAIEAALAASVAVHVAAGDPRIEACRAAEPCGGREPIAGNGRCMSCGAVREIPPTEHVSEPKPVSAPVAPAKPRIAPAARRAPSVDMIARYKAATGATDAAIGDLVKLKRPTIQAILNGRRKERLDSDQAFALWNAAQAQIVALKALAEGLQDVFAGK